MKILLLSSLSKVFKDKEQNLKEFTEFSSFKNEPFSFQVMIYPEKKEEENISFNISSVLKNQISTYIVEDIPSEYHKQDNADDFFYEKKEKYPDLLRPCENRLTLKAGNRYSLWVKYKPVKDISGKKRIKLTFEFDGKTEEKLFTLNIINKDLPEQELLFTNWFHNDCLCSYYGVKIFSRKYWDIVRKYIKNAAEHGINLLLTPVFTPPLDTAVGGERPTVQLVDVEKNGDKYTFSYKNFEKYVKICLESGIKAFEISHFYTQWGAKYAPKIVARVNGRTRRIFGWDTEGTGEEYTSFLTQFALSFDEEVTKLGIKDRCFLHVSDEPNLECMESYKKASDILHSLFKGYRFFDALSDIEFYRSGLVDTPVPCENNVEIFKPEVKNLWTYYCCGQTRSCVPNRMFAMPSQRNRILGILLYKYNAEGFLQWGHNFWYSQHSVREINPFLESDAGKAFPSGDSYVVYPGENGEPLNSLRHEVFYEGFCDMRALKLLESLTSREYAIKILEYDLDMPLTFTNYPHTYSWLLETRKRINDEIIRQCKER